jgi:signal transduction histidine kinase
MLIYSQLSETQMKRLAGNMYKASQQVQQLLDDLLDAGRGQPGHVQQCNLREIVCSVVENLSGTAEAHSVELRIDVPDELELPINRRRIERVFLNLIGNALDAMPEGGAIVIGAASQDNSVIVDVSDTGPGIAPEIRSRLFQPFVTARKASGLGLGLALARQAVVDHGGDMWLNPANGQGASFSFRLPLNSK